MSDQKYLYFTCSKEAFAVAHVIKRDTRINSVETKKEKRMLLLKKVIKKKKKEIKKATKKKLSGFLFLWRIL
jgi:hypothetical protein